MLKQIPSCLSLPWLPRQLPTSKIFSFSSSFKSHLLFLNPKCLSPSTSQIDHQFIWNSSNEATKPRTTSKKKKFNNKKNIGVPISNTNKSTAASRSPDVGKVVVPEEREKKVKMKVNVRALNQNGDPLGRRDLGKSVVKWISQGMRAMATDFASAETQGEFSELRQRIGLEAGLTFVIQAQPYINAVPIPLGLEALCLKACTHYPTLFDHFQRELRDVLQELQRKGLIQNWQQTESWKLLKELANSGFFFLRAVAISSLTIT